MQMVLNGLKFPGPKFNQECAECAVQCAVNIYFGLLKLVNVQLGNKAKQQSTKLSVRSMQISLLLKRSKRKS